MKDHYKLILQRIDNYIGSVNTKGALIVAFNTFITGSIVARYSDIRPLIEVSANKCLIEWLLILVLIISITSIFIVGLAVFPYLKSGNSTTSKYHSHIFFNSIAEFNTEEQFLESCKNYKEQESEEDLKRQIYTLSKGLKKKFKRIGIAMWLFFTNLLILLVILTLIIL